MDISLWRKRKKELHLTYDELVIKSGVPKSTITNIFSGYVVTPRIDTVRAIEDALGINDDGVTIIQPMPYNFSDEEVKLIFDYRMLTPSMKDMIKNTIKTFLLVPNANSAEGDTSA